jgi:CBS domain containing-hemolysin-like protein
MSRTTAAQIMTPWEQCLTLSTDMSERQILDVIKSTTFSRFPVTDKNGRPIGFVGARRYIKAHLESGRPNKLRRVLTPGRTVRADEPVDELLARLSAARTHIAFVRDEENKVLGIITVEDILEELVGEIYDEDDAVEQGGESA